MFCRTPDSRPISVMGHFSSQQPQSCSLSAGAAEYRRQKPCKTKSLAPEGNFSGSDGKKIPSACSRVDAGNKLLPGPPCSERCMAGASLFAYLFKQSRAVEPSVTAPAAVLCLPSSLPAPGLLTRMIITGRFTLSAAAATQIRCSAPLTGSVPPRCGGENVVHPWRCTQAVVLLLCSY